MISQTLFNKIKEIQKKNTIGFLVIMTAIFAFIIYFEFNNNGFNYWMLIPVIIIFAFALFSGKESKVLSILKNNSDQISKIVLDQDDGILEIEVHLKEKNYRYSLNLPFDQGLEVAQDLMMELPNIDFYDDYKNKISNINQAKFKP